LKGYFVFGIDAAKSVRFGSIAFAALALSACDGGANSLKKEALMVTDVRVTVPVSKDAPAAAYFTIEGGPVATRLVAVRAPSAQRVEMHESVTENGMVTMKPLKFVDVPKLKNVDFKPGGKHVMLYGVNTGAIKANKFPMEFMFTNGDTIIVDGVFMTPERQAKEASGHEGH
jgi:periplasmic copper chaperone A